MLRRRTDSLSLLQQLRQLGAVLLGRRLHGVHQGSDALAGLRRRRHDT